MDQDLESTFLEGLEQNKQQMLRICSVYANDEEDRNDLFQEVLINVWKSMSSFKGASSLNTWIYRVTLNVCLRMHARDAKKRKIFRKMDSVELSRYGGLDQPREESQQLVHLRSCIKQLNNSDKGLITLYLEELPYKEIAEITGLTENHVAVKIKRIKTKLLNCINARS